jgi:hypothetical protein
MLDIETPPEAPTFSLAVPDTLIFASETAPDAVLASVMFPATEMPAIETAPVDVMVLFGMNATTMPALSIDDVMVIWQEAVPVEDLTWNASRIVSLPDTADSTPWVHPLVSPVSVSTTSS